MVLSISLGMLLYLLIGRIVFEKMFKDCVNDLSCNYVPDFTKTVVFWPLYVILRLIFENKKAL